jgi:ribonuclease-3
MPMSLHAYEQALRHHSVSRTIHQNGYKDSNERLEYLGDAMLNAIVAEFLFKKYPFKDEGFLTQLRSKIVSRESLNELAIKINLNLLLDYDRKAMQNINLRNSIFGNALEAFIGAIYLDAGFEGCKQFIVDNLLRFHIDVDKLQSTETNFKGRLIEFAQKNGNSMDFDVEEISDGKNKIYKITVKYAGEIKGIAEHTSKKKAEQMAAQKTFELMGLSMDK